MDLNKDKRFNNYVIVAALLCLPAFLWNLGLLPFIGDEAIRALVAFEMMDRGNYLVPTLTGDFYFSKPPLYNWILIIFFKIAGNFNEVTTRVPTVLFSFLFSIIIWYFNRDRLKERKYAIILAFTFLTCGRMIFYDTFLGLIDIFFSMITYSMIMLAYKYAEVENYKKLYFSIYFLSAIGFMLKGFPSFHFLIFALLIIHYMFNSWKQLLSSYHIAAVGLAVALISLYFYYYNQYIDATKTVAPLFDQAARRTILRYDVVEVLKHIVTYPFENIFHFFPWSVMGILFFQKNVIATIKANKYIFYVTLTFTANFLIYWASPEVFPRYILMLIPLVFTLWIYLYEFELGVDNLRMKIIAIIYKLILMAAPIVIIFGFWNPNMKFVENATMKLIILILMCIVVAIIYFNDRPNRIIIFVIFILIVRIGFNTIILPIRSSYGDDAYLKSEAIKIGKKYPGIKLYGSTRLYWISGFYISRETKMITDRTNDLTKHNYYIIDSTYRQQFVPIDSFIDAEFCGTRWIVEGDK
jgi:4-amino-4-deoxy-L-arabinose transferase-like glycosyltransferase